MSFGLRWLSLIGTAAVLAACSGLVGPDGGKRLGIIAFYGDPVVTEVPHTVQAGADFDVAVRTYGGGCISAGETDVKLDGLSVDVRPYDVHSGESVCTSELRFFDHRLTLTIAERGLAQIRFHGKELPAHSTVTVARSVFVQ